MPKFAYLLIVALLLPAAAAADDALPCNSLCQKWMGTTDAPPAPPPPVALGQIDLHPTTITVPPRPLVGTATTSRSADHPAVEGRSAALHGKVAMRIALPVPRPAELGSRPTRAPVRVAVAEPTDVRTLHAEAPVASLIPAPALPEPIRNIDVPVARLGNPTLSSPEARRPDIAPPPMAVRPIAPAPRPEVALVAVAAQDLPAPAPQARRPAADTVETGFPPAFDVIAAVILTAPRR